MILDEQFDADEVLRDLDEEVLEDSEEVPEDLADEDGLKEVDFDDDKAHQECFRELSDEVIDPDLWEE